MEDMNNFDKSETQGRSENNIKTTHLIVNVSLVLVIITLILISLF